MTAKQFTHYDAKGFVDFFGGTDAMVALWEKSGFHLTKFAVEKWLQRNSIPTSRILEAVSVARRKRKPFNISNFVKTKKVKHES